MSWSPRPTRPFDACHHVAIVVRDVETARTFYRDVLGLEELERPADLARRIAGAWFRLGVSELHIFEQREFRPQASAFGPHIALHAVDFDAAIELLRERGVEFAFGPLRAADGVWRAVVRDPTGNVVEITDAKLR